jgi:6-phosphogluconolactonase (cycloisomerase 2 family)
MRKVEGMSAAPSRRLVVGAILAGLSVPEVAAAAMRKGGTMTRFAYVGCRTSRERHAQGKGISVYSIDPASGAWTLVQLVDGLFNPSYLAFDRTRRYLYTVHGDGSEASAFRIDPATGRITFLDRVTTGGRLAYVINELDSTVVAYHFDPATGALKPFQIVSALPDTFTGNNPGSYITGSADGRFVYASNMS